MPGGLDGRFLVTTDDAYVAADITTLAAKASGYVTEVMVADNQAGEEGRRPRPRRQRRLRAGRRPGRERASPATWPPSPASTSRSPPARRRWPRPRPASPPPRRAWNPRTSTSARQSTLVTNKVSAQSQLDDARTDRDAARASARVRRGGRHRRRGQHRGAPKAAEGRGGSHRQEPCGPPSTRPTAILSFTEIRAPVDGVVGNKAVEVGTYVTPGQQLASLVATGSAHIEANYKETQLAEAGSRRDRAHHRRRPRRGGDHPRQGREPVAGHRFGVQPACRPTTPPATSPRWCSACPVRISVPDDVALSGKLRPGLSVVVAADPRTAPTNYRDGRRRSG